MNKICNKCGQSIPTLEGIKIANQWLKDGYTIAEHETPHLIQCYFRITGGSLQVRNVSREWKTCNPNNDGDQLSSGHLYSIVKDP